jgi:signal transduction histidine kinase
MSDDADPRPVGGLRTPELLEVYVWSRDGDSKPIVVESYWTTDQIDSDVRAIMKRIAPLPLVALLLFVLAMFPLGWSLARRVDRAQAESKRSLQHALSAADLERRRIARDLHDGVMQDVSGAGYALSAVSAGLPDDAETPRRLVGEVSRLVRQVGESLRSLVADIYPPNLARDGLAIAVEDLAERAADHGVDVLVDIPGEASRDLPIEVAQLCYRVIREALRNVERHAHASHAEVRAVLDHGAVRITVADDGRGPGTPKDGSGPAHLGLRLLEDTLKDLGGTLSLEPGAAGGAVFTATVPLQVDFV